MRLSLTIETIGVLGLRWFQDRRLGRMGSQSASRRTAKRPVDGLTLALVEKNYQTQWSLGFCRCCRFVWWCPGRIRSRSFASISHWKNCDLKFQASYGLKLQMLLWLMIRSPPWAIGFWRSWCTCRLVSSRSRCSDCLQFFLVHNVVHVLALMILCFFLAFRANVFVLSFFLLQIFGSKFPKAPTDRGSAFLSKSGNIASAQIWRR